MRVSAEQETFPKSADDKFVDALMDENIELRELIAAMVDEIADQCPDGIDAFFDFSVLGTDRIGHIMAIWTAWMHQ